MDDRRSGPPGGSSCLGALAPGSRATVRRVACDRPVARRLMEMGLLPGTCVEVLRVAPLGDPIELRLRGYCLSIRRAEAAGIQVDGVRRSHEALGSEALGVSRSQASSTVEHQG